MTIGIKTNILDHIGSSVDHIFLSIPKILNRIKPKKQIDPVTYEREIDFYFEHGITENPINLFQLNDMAPSCRKLSEKPFKDGSRELYTFKSHFQVLNPLVRDRYHFHENNQNSYFVRWTHGSKTPRKTILCLHGYMLGAPNQAEKMFSVKRLYQKGLDVVLFISPFHWKRAPVNKLDRGIFLQPDDVVMTCEAVSHTMTDLNTTFNILNDMGVKEIGIIGASMGAYNASLFSCLTDRISFAAMIVPALDYSKPFGPDSVHFDFPVNTRFREKMNTIWTLHSPLNFYPKIDKDKLIFIASKGDQLCLSENVYRILKKWDWPQHFFLTGGHWLIFNNQKRGQLWYKFLEDMGFWPDSAS